MAFSEHKQITVDAGDRVIISASAIPGNENMISKVIDELFHKGAEVIYDRRKWMSPVKEAFIDLCSR